jgi:hypothetical protein
MTARKGEEKMEILTSCVFSSLLACLGAQLWWAKKLPTNFYYVTYAAAAAGFSTLRSASVCMAGRRRQRRPPGITSWTWARRF